MSDQIAERLAAAGFIAAPEEAEDLRAAARGNGFLLDSMVSQRLEGQPLAWITGRTVFCGLEVQIDPGVYVPRTHGGGPAERAAELLPERGFAIDLCTGSGAIAMVLSHRRPGARVLATDVDPVAVDCARANGVAAHRGDLFSALPPGIDGLADVVVAVVPYVPEAELGLLQRDRLRFETRLSYDGGRDGLAVLRRIPREALR